MSNQQTNHNCKVSRTYPKCTDGEVCQPIEGSFVTECETANCKKFN